MSDWQTIAPQLRTILRPPSRPANRQRVALYASEKSLFSYPIAPFLDALVAIDHDDTRTFVTNTQLETWGVEPEFLMRQGLANLAPAEGLRQSREHEGLWMLRPSDGYASSRVLMPGWLDAFKDKCIGDPVTALPVAGVVLIADSGREEAMANLVHQAWELYSTEGDPLSPVPYQRHQGFGLKPWTPQDDHPLDSDLTKAFLYLAGNEYAHQQSLLQEWAKTQDPPPFVAPFLMMKRHGAMGGMTVLPGRPSLLPMATWVRQGTEDPKADMPLKTWQELVEDGTIRSPETHWNPPRWWVG